MVATPPKPTELEGKMLAIIRKKPQITKRELTVALDIAEETVKEHLQRLRKKGPLVRRGGWKEGYWEIVV